MKAKLLGILILSLLGGLVFSAPLSLWHTSFVSEWSGKDAVIQMFEQNNDQDVAGDYGPALYRDVTQKLIIQARTGTPDVVESVLEQMFTFAKAGLLYPLDEFWDAYPDKDEYAQNAVDALRFQGHLYGIPYNTNVRLLLYRKSVFAENGLKVPETWDELINTAAYITKNVPDMQGFMFTTKTREVRAFQEFMSFYFQLNKHMFNVTPDGVEVVATEEQLTRVLDVYQRMFFEGGIDLNERGADWKALDYGYTAGKYAMVTVGPWIWSHRFEEDARGEVLDDTGIVAIPVADDGTPGTYMEVKPISINAYTEDPQGAWELAKQVTSKDFQLLIDSMSGVLSPRNDVMQMPEMKDNWWLSGFGKYMDTGVALDPVSWEQPQNFIIEAIQKVIYKQMTPQQAGAWLLQNLQRIASSL
ncbi:MAG TPA: extracellular solute-binding protein [Thermotogota bacterium]|nr:extracellular solute-binding protein [Thermotogota bacterium]